VQGQEQQDCSPCQEAGDGHGYNRPVPGGWGGDSGAHGLLSEWVPRDRGSGARPTPLLSGAEDRGRASRFWLKTAYMPHDFPSRDKKYLA
jgi:hypothetical protein